MLPHLAILRESNLIKLIVDLTSELDPRDLFTAISGCDLMRQVYKHHRHTLLLKNYTSDFRAQATHYVGQNERSVLIVLRGLERLRHTSANNSLEFLRSFYDFGEHRTYSLAR